MDPAKAQELEAAMQDASPASVQPHDHSAAPTAPLPQGDSDAPLPTRPASPNKLRLSKQPLKTRSSHTVGEGSSASAKLDHTGSKDAKLPKQAIQRRSVRDVHAPLQPVADEEDQTEERATEQPAVSIPGGKKAMHGSSAGPSLDIEAEHGDTAAACASNRAGDAQNPSVSDDVGSVQPPAGPSEARCDSQHSVSPGAGQEANKCPVSKGWSKAAASKGTEAKHDDVGTPSLALRHLGECVKDTECACWGVHVCMHEFVYLFLDVPHRSLTSKLVCSHSQAVTTRQQQVS